MNKIKISDALIKATYCLQFDKNLSNTEKIEYENALIDLRKMILDEKLLEKSELSDGLKRIAEVSNYDDRTQVLFDRSKLINLLGNRIGDIMGNNTSNISSVGIK